ncbi:hypothetical protein CCACVL1_01884, partial [Corchorus capsularis]
MESRKTCGGRKGCVFGRRELFASGLSHFPFPFANFS